MKKVLILIYFTLTTLLLSAKPANALWFFLEPSSKSISSNEQLDVQYGIYTLFANTEYNLGPYPVLRIKITNKTGLPVYVDLGTSFIKRNGFASVIFTPTVTQVMGQVPSANVGLGGMMDVSSPAINAAQCSYAQRYVAIPPEGTVLLNDIVIFPVGSETSMSGVYHFSQIGSGRQKCTWCVAYPRENIARGDAVDYLEGNTPFTLGCYINYSFSEDFRSSLSLESEYFVSRIVGSVVNTFPLSNAEFDTVDNVFPLWRNKVGTGEMEVIRLWAMR